MYHVAIFAKFVANLVLVVWIQSTWQDCMPNTDVQHTRTLATM
jgi:hypothetical protein